MIFEKLIGQRVFIRFNRSSYSADKNAIVL